MLHLPRHWPLVPTLIVALAALTMVALGVWQLRRADQKQALIAEIQHNPARPAIVFPRFGPVPPESMFRRSTVNCLRVEKWSVEAGRGADGSSGFRYIADCLTGAEGPGTRIAVGIGRRPDLKPSWNGDIVSGWVTREPDHRSVLGHLTQRDVVLRPMLIAARSPVGGLKPLAPPRIDDIPNNHMAYAVQWFLFAAISVIIYVLALGRREAKAVGDS